jgi:CBS-domain-containing membrane protein
MAEPQSASGPKQLAARFGPDVVRGLLERLRLVRLLERYHERHVWACFMFINGFVTIGILAGIAMLLRTPFIFPSLGPTAILFFFSPTLSSAWPRNTLYGHAIGILCGYGSLLVCGLAEAPPATVVGVDGPRILAAALSLAATSTLMILLRTVHPPAGATTLIVSLGIVIKPLHLVTIEIAIAVLALQAIIINRAAGVDYPFWAKSPPASAAPGKTPSR